MKFITIIFSLNLIFLSTNEPTSHKSNPIDIIKDYEKGLVIAQEAGKPIFLLFTGHACLNNIKIRELIRQDAPFQTKLSEEFVNVHLYVDDNSPLENIIIKPTKIPGQTIRLRTIGNKWSFLEQEKFNSNVQPLVVIIDSDENILAGPAEYNDIKDDLIGFLNY